MKKEILNSTILLWILGSIDILLLVMWALIDGRLPKYLFGADNPKANGDFLTICFSVIGGGAVIYGLYLNNKRIKEQTRQNDIAMKQADIAANNNNDKRFGDAIGYLNSHNVGIAIGGAYTLFQIAKEDTRYTPIVANIFSKYLAIQYNADLQNSTIRSIIIDLLLLSGYAVFKGITLSFHSSNFDNVEFIDISNIIFRKCQFDNVQFSNINHCELNECNINDCQFKDCDYLLLNENYITKLHIYNINIQTNSLKITSNNIIHDVVIHISKIIGQVVLVTPDDIIIDDKGNPYECIEIFCDDRDRIRQEGIGVELREYPLGLWINSPLYILNSQDSKVANYIKF